MPRKILIRSAEFPYHIFNRTLEHKFYEIPLEEIWEEASAILRILSWAFDFRIHAFVLMANHYHLLVSTPSANINAGVRYFQSELSRWIHLRTGRQNFRFGARYGRSMITNLRYARDVYRYIIQNPVRAGLVATIEDYAHSTIHAQLGLSKLCIPIYPISILDSVPEIHEEAFLEWANDLPDENHLRDLRRGLMHATFKMVKRYRACGKSA